MTTLEVIFRATQIAVFTVTFFLAGWAYVRRQNDIAAGKWTKEGREQFRAYLWLLTAILISIVIGTGLGVEMNPGGVLVVAASIYCAYTLRPRRRP